MAKPTKLPRWATVGGAAVVEPVDGKKTAGWAVEEKPPAQYKNWLDNLNYQWATYFNQVGMTLDRDVGERLGFSDGTTMANLLLTKEAVSHQVLGPPHLFGLRGGDGFIDHADSAAATRVVRNRAGTIFQKVNGLLVPYTMAAEEVNLTLAVGDGSNPRVDVIQVQLTVDETSATPVSAAFSVKQGTPAATPAFPTLDAGRSALGAVYVPTGFNSTFSEAHWMDTRIPINVRSMDVPPIMMHTTGGFTFASGGAGEGEWTSGGAGSMIIPCPLASHQRVLGLQVVAQQVDAGTSDWSVVQLKRGSTVLADILTEGGFHTGTALEMEWVSLDGLFDTLIPSASTPSGTKNAAGLGTPIWGNGRQHGCNANEANSPKEVMHLLMTTTAASSKVQRARWFYSD